MVLRGKERKGGKEGKGGDSSYIPSFLSIPSILAILSILFVAACSPAPVPLPTSTVLPSAPPRISTPTARPTAVTTPIPAPAVASVRVEKPFTILVPQAVGSVGDMAARLVAPLLEKELRAPVQVANRPNVSEAAREMSNSGRDDYTVMLFTLPTHLSGYLNPERQPSYARSDFVPVAGLFVDRLAIAVRLDSNFEIPQDVVGYAKATPFDFAVGTTGSLSATHLGPIDWAEQAGMKLSYFHFGGSVESIPRLLVGRLDAVAVTTSAIGVNLKVRNIKPLGVMDEQESPLLPGVPTFASQGFPVSAPTYYCLVAPAGTPPVVVGALSEGVRNAVTSSGYRTRLSEIGTEAKYLSPADLDALWTRQEAWAKPLIEIANKK